MLTFDSVKLRLEREQPLTFLEFNYMLLQAYDFLELARRYNCILQIGGTVSKATSSTATESARRRAEGRELLGLTTPLLTTSSGAKMGKSVKGAIWLNADMLSPYDYWQFWRNTEDADVGRFLAPSRNCRLRKSQASKRFRARKSTTPRRCWQRRRQRFCMAGRREAAAETARKAFEEGAAAEGLPTVESQGRNWKRGSAF